MAATLTSLALTVVAANLRDIASAEHVERLPDDLLHQLVEILVREKCLTDTSLLRLLHAGTRKVHLKNCTNIRKIVLCQVPLLCPRLAVLDLTNCHQVNNECVRQVLQGCSTLHTLIIDGCFRISDAAFQPRLFSVSQCFLSLQTLSFAYCSQITDACVESLVKAGQHIKNICLSHCKLVSDPGVRQILDSCSHLEELDVSFCDKITDNAFPDKQWASDGVKALNVNSCRVTDLSVASICASCPELRKLKMHSTGVTAKSLVLLADACPKLELLGLQCCSGITSLDGVPGSLDITMPSLRGLDLAWCTELMDNLLIDVATMSTTLERLNIAGCNNITDIGVTAVANSCHYLREYFLSLCTNLTDGGVAYIATHCTHLETLELKLCSNVTDDSVRKLAVHNSLLKLSLYGSNITDSSVMLVAQSCPRLRKFCISNCNVTDAGVTAIAESCALLSFLDLSGCPVTNEGILALCKLPLLTHLVLDNNSTISESAVQTVLNTLLYLECVEVRGCSNLSAAAFSSRSAVRVVTK